MFDNLSLDRFFLDVVLLGYLLFIPFIFSFPIFSCEGAALEVLMYVCPSVCLQVENFKFMKVPVGSRKVLKVPEGS